MPDTRLTFHHQLDDVQRDLLRVAARVTEVIARGTEALLTLDLAEARGVDPDPIRTDEEPWKRARAAYD